MKYLIYCLAASFTFSLICLGQTSPQRQVTVITADDKKYEGAFIKADESGVTIEEGDAQTTIKLDTVKLIMFGGSTAAAPTSSPTSMAGGVTEKERAGAQALKSLRRIDSATAVGITYIQYRQLLIEVKAEVDDALRKLSDDDAKNGLAQAMVDYELAGQAWYVGIRNARPGGAHISTKSDLWRTINERYSVGIKPSAWRDIYVNDLLPVIWGAARARLEKVAALL